MKKTLLLIVPAIMLFSCQQCPEAEQPDLDAEKKKVETVLERYVVANETQQLELVHQVWSPQEDIIVIGTDSDEILKGWDNIKDAIADQFSVFEETYISVTDQDIRLSKTGQTAWFSQIINYNFIFYGEAKSFEGIRFTGVLEKIEGEWYILQSHMSIPHDTPLEKPDDIPEPQASVEH